MLLHMLIFDAWHDLIASPTGATLQATLAESEVEADQRLSQQIKYCITSLPSNTDEWIRLFISCIQDLDGIGVIICDMSLSYAPIIYANSGFQSMTGYSLEEVVGRSCRFLQGPKSDPEAIEAIRDSIRSGTQTDVRLINYRKNGSTYLNMLSLRPIFDQDGHFVFMVAVTIEVVESFGKMQPLLTQVNRLNKLLPESIALPAPPSVQSRVSLVHNGMMAARAEQRMQRSQQTASETSGTASLQAKSSSRAVHNRERTAEQARPAWGSSQQRPGLSKAPKAKIEAEEQVRLAAEKQAAEKKSAAKQATEQQAAQEQREQVQEAMRKSQERINAEKSKQAEVKRVESIAQLAREAKQAEDAKHKALELASKTKERIKAYNAKQAQQQAGYGAGPSPTTSATASPAASGSTTPSSVASSRAASMTSSKIGTPVSSLPSTPIKLRSNTPKSTVATSSKPKATFGSHRAENPDNPPPPVPRVAFPETKFPEVLTHGTTSPASVIRGQQNDLMPSPPSEPPRPTASKSPNVMRRDINHSASPPEPSLPSTSKSAPQTPVKARRERRGTAPMQHQ